MMRCLVPAAFLCSLVLPAAAGEPGQFAETDRVAIHFEHAASRMREGEGERIAGLKGRIGAEPDSRLVLLQPRPRDPIRLRFLAARLAELDRSLRGQGLIPERRLSEEIPDEDGLWVVIVQSVHPGAVSAPVPDTEVANSVELPPPQAQSAWSADPGHTLREILGDWGRQAGWSVVWQSAYDYPIEAAARFSGDFSDAVTKMLGGFAEATPAPKARIFRDNKVLLVQ